MAEQAVDIETLRAATEALNSMIGYSSALHSGASAFAHMLPAEWQGPASARFLMAFETWALSAAALTEATAQLQAHTTVVLNAYETGTTELDSQWTGFNASLGA